MGERVHRRERIERTGECEKDEERQSHRAFPGPSIGNLTNVSYVMSESIKINKFLTK